jgi:virginiamycin B lyase
MRASRIRSTPHSRASRRAGLGLTVGVLLTFALAPPATAAISELALPTAASAPTGITVGADGNLWAVESAANRVVRVTPTGGLTEFTLPANREPLQIASAAGFLWFTERNGDRIGRLNPSAGGDSAVQSSVTEFVVSGAGSRPTGIAAGPDGLVWFTETGSDQVGRPTLAGVMTEFAVPGAGSAPTGIAPGPDGALWFTQAGSGEVGRITTAGVVTNEFAVPALEPSATRLGAITQGPDGALWFVDEGLDHVRRITTSGGHSQFAGPAGSGLAGIATGPDGALWLTEARSGKVARMTTGGGLSEYTLPTRGAGPTGITAGPDGAMWFTERLSAAIGRISTDTPPDALPTGPPGPPGAPGPAGRSTLVVVAFQALPARPRAGRRLRVRYAITGPARVVLQVKRGRARARTVARRSVRRAGVGTLAWNGKLGRRRARPGKYTFIVRATRDGLSASSRLRIRLR